MKKYWVTVHYTHYYDVLITAADNATEDLIKRTAERRVLEGKEAPDYVDVTAVNVEERSE